MTRSATNPKSGRSKAAPPALPRCAARQLAGFTLVEVIFATFVMLVTSGGVLMAVLRTHEMIASSRATFRATVVLNEKMEELRSASFAAVNSMTFDQGTITANEARTGDLQFHWTRTISAYSGGSDTLVARVSVSWTEGGRSRSMEAVTYLAKDGIVNKSPS